MRTHVFSLLSSPSWGYNQDTLFSCNQPRTERQKSGGALIKLRRFLVFGAIIFLLAGGLIRE